MPSRILWSTKTMMYWGYLEKSKGTDHDGMVAASQKRKVDRLFRIFSWK